MTILPTLIQSVAHPPRDGKQPGSVRTSSPEPVQAAPIDRPAVSGGFGGKPSIPSEDAGGVKMDDESRPGRAPHGVHKDTQSSHAATFPIPQASSSQASAGNSASIAHDLGDLPPLFVPAFLAAWRESQAQPTDAEPRGR